MVQIIRTNRSQEFLSNTSSIKAVVPPKKFQSKLIPVIRKSKKNSFLDIFNNSIMSELKNPESAIKYIKENSEMILGLLSDSEQMVLLNVMCYVLCYVIFSRNNFD